MEDIRSHDEPTAWKLAVNLEDMKPHHLPLPAMARRFSPIADAGDGGDLVGRFAVWDWLMDWPAYRTRRLPEADLCGLDRESCEIECAALNAEYVLEREHALAVAT